MDGIIFDSESLYYIAGQELLRRRAHDFTAELAIRMMGIPGVDAMEILRQALHLPDSARSLYDECQVIFDGMLETHLTLMPGLLGLLEHIEAARLPKAVATSTARVVTERMLRQFDLLHRFHFTLTRDDVHQGKPHPEIYLAACDRLQCTPSEVLVIEDSQNGMRAAKAAGCHCVVVPHELTRTLDFSLADLIANHLLDDRLVHYLPISR
jgi:HAD superfamily hydrolase (TIGR01509 family)